MPRKAKPDHEYDKDAAFAELFSMMGLPDARKQYYIQRRAELQKMKADGTLDAYLNSLVETQQSELVRLDPRERLRQKAEDRWEKLGIKKLLPEEKDFVVLQGLVWEVNGGSFDQYLHNSSGDDALVALDALERIGARKTRALLSKVIALVGEPYPTKRTARQRALRELDPEDEPNIEYTEQIMKLTDQFHKLDEEIVRMSLEAVEKAYHENGIEWE